MWPQRDNLQPQQSAAVKADNAISLEYIIKKENS